MNVILASQSPRRKELLKKIFNDFEIIPADIDETVPDGMPCSDVSQFLAAEKAKKVASDFPKELVIGSDTIVLCDDKILGKPINFDEAFKMLSMLSGKTHYVITGVCICCKGKTVCFKETSAVTFKNVSSQDIILYINTEKPYDKAGGYGIQDNLSSLIINDFSGDFDNIVGLPVLKLKNELLRHNFFN